MNKNQILNALEKYNLDKDKFMIISSAAMVINDIKKETKDIDIAIEQSYEEILLKQYKCDFEREIIDNGKTYKVYMIDNIINFSNHYNEYNYEYKYGYKVQTVDDILKLKERLDRDKDQKDIKLLKEFLNKREINSLSLAYLGDAVYELYIRQYLLKGNIKVNELQNSAKNYVSAKAQSNFLNKMIEDKFLTEEELQIVKRARNHKSHSSKSTDIITYKKSTGLEALIGYLKITNNSDRIDEIMKYIVGE